MSAPVSASAIRHRLVLQKAVYARDEIGGTVVMWQDAASLWGSIEPLRGEERFNNQKFEAHRFFKISTRFRADITTSARFRKGERQFLIRSVMNRDEENHTLEMVCEEIL